MAGGEPTRRLTIIVAVGDRFSHDPPSGVLGLGLGAICGMSGAYEEVSMMGTTAKGGGPAAPPNTLATPGPSMYHILLQCQHLCYSCLTQARNGQ